MKPPFRHGGDSGIKIVDLLGSLIIALSLYSSFYAVLNLLAVNIWPPARVYSPGGIFCQVALSDLVVLGLVEYSALVTWLRWRRQTSKGRLRQL
jgi:hypothetical protein